MLYRHNDNPLESILACVDTVNNNVDILHGSDSAQNLEIGRFLQSANIINNTLPMYNCHYTQGIVPYYPTTLVLNRERELFTKAKDILMGKLKNQQSDRNNYSEIMPYLAKLYEA